MRAFCHCLEKFYQLVVILCFGAITLFLAVAAACSTYYVTADKDELPYSVADHPLINILAVVCLVAVCVLLFRRERIPAFTDRLNGDPDYYKKIRRILLVAELIIGVFWVLSSQFEPGADQKLVLDGVYEASGGNLETFLPSGYLSNYPQQYGLFWFEYLLQLFVGNYNIVVFQLINVIFICIFMYELTRILELFGFAPVTRLAAEALCIAFIPLTLFSSFIYGNIIGLALSLLAIRHEIDFFNEHKKSSLLLMAVYAALALAIKSNYLIFVITMMVYAVARALHDRKAKHLLIVLLLLVCYLVQSKGILAVTKAFSGQELNRHVNSWGYIAMGLHDGQTGPGWYDAYVFFSMEAANYTPDVQAEAAKQDIKDSLGYYLSNPDRGVDFLCRKITSQWNNPTYQCFWNVQFRESQISLPRWVSSLTGGRLNTIATEYLNLLQFALLIGSLLYLILANKKDPLFTRTLLFAVAIIGGFLFHILWEAKSQYIFSYFVLYIPYAAAGYHLLVSRICARLDARKQA